MSNAQTTRSMRFIAHDELTEDHRELLEDSYRRHADRDRFACVRMVEEIMPSGEKMVYPLVECKPDQSRGSLKFPEARRQGGWYF